MTFTVANAPSASLISPTPSQVVGAPALLLEHSMTGGTGTQQSYRYRIFAADGTTVAHDSGEIAGTGTSYLLPVGVLRNAREYYAQAFTVDTLGQEASSSKVAFTTLWAPPAAIAGLMATAVGSQE
jgi:hypothetical protein